MPLDNDAAGLVDGQTGARGDSRAVPPRAAFEQLSADAQAILSAAVRLRLLSFGQVHRLLFPTRHPTLMRRHLRILQEAGWIAFRDGVRSGRGRPPRFVLPTRRCFAAVLPRLQETTAREPFAQLIADMLPPASVRPLAFPDRTMPNWLPHQIEVNHLVTSIATSTRAIRWASAWDAPFRTDGAIRLPQPDYVLVENMGGHNRIVFGEHDRATESIASFLARKVDIYTNLARFPEVTGPWFGTAPFVVHVSVIDRRGSPMRRLRELLDLAALSRYPECFRFTLGGWLFAYPDRPVFFSTANVPAHDSLHWEDHATMNR